MKSWSPVLFPGIDISMEFPLLRIHDSASGKVKELAEKKLYRMYVCGITPYDATHLGHAATYLTFDLINRFLVSSGASVRYVQNITDIDDPLLERAKRDGIDWTHLAHSQIDLFRSDMEALRVMPPLHYIGAVEAIPLVVEAIKALEEKNSVYPVGADLYFETSRDENFGSRSHLGYQEMLSIFSERGGDPEREGKRSPLDPLLWMSQRPDEPGWDSPFGTGRPGWHIECTAIALKYLDPTYTDAEIIDIQGGGSDLIFPHHEMCASQVQVMTGKPFASAFVHSGMIGLDGEKMSKSRGNLVFVSKLLQQGTEPMAIRWALMSHHYRTDRMWTQELLESSELVVQRLHAVLNQENIAPTDALISLIIEHLSNDLDTPAVLLAIENWVIQSEQGAEGGDPQSISAVLDQLLGLKV